MVKSNKDEVNKMEQLTKSEKISLSISEISKKVKQQLRKEFPKCKFSVTKESYSGGCSLSADLLEADFKVIRDIEEISEVAILCLGSGYSKENIAKRQESRYHQLNQYTNREDFDPNKWNNGVFLTQAGHNLFKRVQEIVDQYNYDNSDPQSDYFDVNFYFHPSIGKWNKEFKGVSE